MVIWPWLITAAFGFAAWSVTSLPPFRNARAAASLLLAADTISPAVLTCEPL